MRNPGRPWIITIALAVTLVTPMSANAENQRRDITNTPRGQQIANDSAARFTAQGVPTEGSTLAVMEFPDGGVTVLPARLSDTLAVSSRIVDGSQRFSATIDVGDTLASASSSEADGSFQVAAAAYWAYRESACFASLYVKTARFDVCYKISKLINDGSTTKDWYALEQWGTAFESAIGLRSAFVSGQRRAGSNTQNWDGRWSPSTSITKTNCQTYFVGITHFVTIGANYEVCEKWTITKSANGTSPYFKSEWGCNSFGCGVQQTDRDVAYTIETSLGQGLTPLYTLGYGMNHW